MKRSVAAAAVVVAFSCLSGPEGSRVADAQVLSTMPPPTFGSRLMGVSEAGGSFALPVVEEQINVDIDGQHASTRLRQTFYNRSDNVIGSPICTSFNASSRLATPISKNNSSIFTGFLSPSCLVRCGATLPTTPFTGPFLL